jgi:hypothetical protein
MNIKNDATAAGNRNSDEEWLWISSAMNKHRGWSPNWVAYNNSGEWLIQIKQSNKHKRFYLTAPALYDALNALQDGKIKAAFVRLVARDETVLAQLSALNVWGKLARIKPRQGDYGDYWALNINFDPVVYNEIDKQSPI